VHEFIASIIRQRDNAVENDDALSGTDRATAPARSKFPAPKAPSASRCSHPAANLSLFSIAAICSTIGFRAGSIGQSGKLVYFPRQTRPFGVADEVHARISTRRDRYCNFTLSCQRDVP
jgi:hypothetical protein